MKDDGSAVIDLGVAGSRGVEEPSPDHRWSSRAWLVGAVAAMTVVTLAGAAAPVSPPRPVIRIAFDAEVGQAFAAGGTVVVHRPGTLTGYRADDGAALWAVPSDFYELLGARVAGGVIVLHGATMPDAEGMFTVFTVVTLAVDAASGATRWQRPGYPVYFADDRVTLLDSGSPETAAIQVRPDNGSTVWQLYQPPGTGLGPLKPSMQIPASAPPTQAVAVRPGGQAMLVDLLSGRVSELGMLPNVDIQYVTSDTVLGQTIANGDLLWVAFDRATLRPLWRQPVAADDPSQIVACGTYLCRSGQQAGRLDWRTGQPVWINPQVGKLLGLWHRSGRDLLIATGPGDDGHLVLVDAATGTTVLNGPGNWQFSAPLGNNVLTTLAWSTHDFQPWVGVIRSTGPATIRPLAPVTGQPALTCQNFAIVGRHLMCQATRDILLIPIEST